MDIKRRRRRKSRLKVTAKDIDYKNVDILKKFMSDKGKINPARVTGADAKLQRKIARAIKRARNIALLPYTNTVSK
ncbi:MAG: rpsR [Fusobacteriales bacterium]|jgi:small subunit ribosomal protein S18|nr:rpsR [Fusobacteriales bacterium]